MATVCVLIVDDNPDVQDLLRALLELKGFEVLTAGDGAAALQFLARLHPDLILTDIRMPKMDGLELIHRVRGAAEFADIPIIAMSAYGSGRMSETRGLGVAATIRKPTDFDCLVDIIRQVLSQGTPSTPAERPKP